LIKQRAYEYESSVVRLLSKLNSTKGIFIFPSFQCNLQFSSPVINQVYSVTQIVNAAATITTITTRNPKSEPQVLAESQVAMDM
jgi:hypothetical protein